MKKVYLNDLWKNVENYIGQEVLVKGWIRNHRKQKEFGFINFSDGTCFKTLQIVYDKELDNFSEVVGINFGSAIEVVGVVNKSIGAGQDYELKATSIKLLGECAEDYPLQPKRHTNEFFREIGYLRPRANLFQAVFRIRSIAAMAIHTYFQERGYIYLHAPLITGSDCEGAGEMFQVTAFDLDNLKDKIDYSKDFFGKKTSLTVSGQLQGEAFAMAFSKIYTFGPTFRAENSNTKTHAAEFWMIEPEIAFCSLDELMDIEEDMLRYIVKSVLDKASEEINFLDKFVENGLIDKLRVVLNNKAIRITHKEAIEILQNSGKNFEFKPEQGEDLAKEHEKYLTEEYFKSPVCVYNWPKDIKAFYMKLNDDNETVAAVDLLVPGSGELMGGSQREEDYDKLLARMKELGVPSEEMDWYCNLRRYGSCVHSGFGMGFERLIMYLTGVDNIRDVIPFPRTPGNCEF